MASDVSGTEALPYRLSRPASEMCPIVIASPHSGSEYPARFRVQSRLPLHLLRRSEDAFVDELFARAPALGMTLIAGRYGRSYIDLNREPFELDPMMFHDSLPAYARTDSERLRAGLGTLPRVVGAGLDIYRAKLSFADAKTRVQEVHAPYHAAVSAAILEARRAHGFAVLVDCHSMPSAQPGNGSSAARAGPPTNIVLGDRFGTSCAPELTALIEALLLDAGFSVSRNRPYAGGYTTECYGEPLAGIHALQVEIDRGLYMDELKIVRADGFAEVHRRLTQVLEALGPAISSLPLAPAGPLAEAAE